jgi:hypothetical protein
MIIIYGKMNLWTVPTIHYFSQLERVIDNFKMPIVFNFNNVSDGPYYVSRLELVSNVMGKAFVNKRMYGALTIGGNERYNTSKINVRN